ncbi:MAG: serine/threonine-protein phosphatase [Clostridiaceae bacterium]|nr:serine/threonine-protein phosphatase [Clostridiaceae bacterium]
MSNLHKFAAATDRGLVRQDNQDAYRISSDPESGVICLVVADGVGGHKHGELASGMVVDYFMERVGMILDTEDYPTEEEWLYFLRDTMEKANTKVWIRSKTDPDLEGMCTTMTTGLIVGNRLIIGHIGDCRVFLERENRLFQLTQDHTYAHELLREGVISQDEISEHAGRHQLTRALGVPEYMNIDLITEDLYDGDRLLFCTDGLYGYTSAQELHAILTSGRNPEAIARRMIEAANLNGGWDNVTAIVGLLNFKEDSRR